MKKLLLVTMFFTGCYNNHYYPDPEEPVGSGDVEINVDQQQPQRLEVPARADDLPRPKPTPPPKVKKKYRKCLKWGD